MDHKTLSIIKIGGNVIDQPESLSQFLQDLHQLTGPKLLVHGGGKLATRMAADLGIKSEMIEGRRVTDAESLRIVTMVYAGWINKCITAKLQSLGCNAIGLSGADAAIIKGNKRPVQKVDYGFVADIPRSGVNAQLICNFLNMGLMPVFCSIAADAQGQLLNCNADTIAAVLAIGLSKYYQTKLIYCFEKLGVLSNSEDDQSWIAEIDPNSYLELKQSGQITGGMLPKIDNAFDALHAGVKEVHIKHAGQLNTQIGTCIHL